MIFAIAAFTEKGYELASKVESSMPEVLVRIKDKDAELKTWVSEAFYKHVPLIFIGATGIAVRTISPFVSDKLVDSPVIVIDEKGSFIIPILSGHVGGANEIALCISTAIGGIPVITTATDVENVFAVDVFARKNYLKIINRDGIRKVSSKLLRGEPAYLYIDGVNIDDNDEIPENIIIEANKENADICLAAKKYVLGVGCKKGKSFEELKAFIEDNLTEEKIDVQDIAAIATIDLKAKEYGLNEVSHFYHLPMITFSAEELKRVEGHFSESEFVQSVTGVDNVCERAALCFAENGELVVRKKAKNGMTFALARFCGRIQSWET